MASVDLNTGEVLPDPSEFVYFELGAFVGNGFTRNDVRHKDKHIEWYRQYDKRGIFRSVLASNASTIEEWDDPKTLFYGDLCFDMDVSKDVSQDAWAAMVDEVDLILLPTIQQDFGLSRTDLKVWFSGSRGLHIEVPAKLMGVWPDHDLNRVYGWYAQKIKQDRGMRYLDLSLYGYRHLYRLEYSIHQRTGYFKSAIPADSLCMARDYMALTKSIGASPKSHVSTSIGSYKAAFKYATIVRESQHQSKGIPEVKAGERGSYQESDYHCIETMMTDGYMVPDGARQTAVYLYANHLAQNGFEYLEAEQLVHKLIEEHCDPHYTSRSELHLVNKTLTDAFSKTSRVGCSYVQRNLTSLCQESECPIGRAMIKQRQFQK